MTPAVRAQRERDRREGRRALVSRTRRRTGEERFRTDELLDAVIDGAPIHMFVMAADIRESTTLMKEAIRVRTLRARDGQVRELGAPWDPRDRRLVRQVHRRRVPRVLDGAGRRSPRRVRGAVRPDGRRHRRTRPTGWSSCSTAGSWRTSAATRGTCPAGVGLSMGLDAGPGYLMKIADELTWSGRRSSARSGW